MMENATNYLDINRLLSSLDGAAREVMNLKNDLRSSIKVQQIWPEAFIGGSLVTLHQTARLEIGPSGLASRMLVFRASFRRIPDEVVRHLTAREYEDFTGAVAHRDWEES